MIAFKNKRKMELPGCTTLWN